MGFYGSNDPTNSVKAIGATWCMQWNRPREAAVSNYIEQLFVDVSDGLNAQM